MLGHQLGALRPSTGPCAALDHARHHRLEVPAAAGQQRLQRADRSSAPTGSCAAGSARPSERRRAGRSMVSTPPAMPASIWPSAILCRSGSRLRGWCRRRAACPARGLRIRPDDSTLSRTRLKSLECFRPRRRPRRPGARPAAVAIDDAAQRGRQHVLIASARVGAMSAGERNANATDNSDVLDPRSNQHGFPLEIGSSLLPSVRRGCWHNRGCPYFLIPCRDLRRRAQHARFQCGDRCCQRPDLV